MFGSAKLHPTNKQTFSLNVKKEILKKEREIIYQELKDPVLTQLRGRISDSELKRNTPEGASPSDVIQMLNLRALRELEFIGKVVGYSKSSKKENCMIVSLGAFALFSFIIAHRTKKRKR